MNDHHCHAAGCGTKVPPRLLFCPRHWKMLPRQLQDLVWKAYRKGQERDKQPSLIYIGTQQLCVSFVAEKEGRKEDASKALAMCNRVLFVTEHLGYDGFKARPLRECATIIAELKPCKEGES